MCCVEGKGRQCAVCVEGEGRQCAVLKEEDDSVLCVWKEKEDSVLYVWQEEGDSVLCVVCMDAPSTHAFVPCGHRSVCAACSVTVFGMFNQLCPVRRFPSPLHQIIFCVGER